MDGALTFIHICVDSSQTVLEYACVSREEWRMVTTVSWFVCFFSVRQEMASSLREHPLWKDDGEEDFNWAVEALEKYDYDYMAECLYSDKENNG